MAGYITVDFYCNGRLIKSEMNLKADTAEMAMTFWESEPCSECETATSHTCDFRDQPTSYN